MNTYKTDNIKNGDIIFSLKGDQIKEWMFMSINPYDNKLLSIVDKETGNFKNIHWKTLEYGTNHEEFFSLSKDQLIERYNKWTEHVISKISQQI